jgi:hypothetical protein
MTAITLRNLPAAVVKAVKEKARREKISLNKAVAALLEEATGSRTGKKVLHRDLDHLAGSWSEQEYEQITLAVREQRQVDPEMWK